MVFLFEKASQECVDFLLLATLPVIGRADGSGFVFGIRRLYQHYLVCLVGGLVSNLLHQVLLRDVCVDFRCQKVFMVVAQQDVYKEETCHGAPTETMVYRTRSGVVFRGDVAVCLGCISKFLQGQGWAGNG